MDALEIIRQLQVDSALRAQLRAVLMGEEVLSLPDLIKENSRHIAALADRMERVEVQIAENSRQIAALTDRMERVEVQIAENSRQIAALTEAVREHDRKIGRVEDRLGRLDGKFTEESYRRSFATRIADIEGSIRRVKVLSKPEQADLSFEAADEDLINESEARELREADVVAEGRMRSTGEMVTVVAEIATTVHIDDVLRAIRRAEIASRATKRRGIAVVMGEKAQVIQGASHPGVWLVENNRTKELLGGSN